MRSSGSRGMVGSGGSDGMADSCNVEKMSGSFGMLSRKFHASL